MAFVQFSSVSLAFGERDILKSVSINLASGTKAALSGANGSGKTTLMRVLAGMIKPDSGERAIQKGTITAYLPQSGIVHSGRSLYEEAELAFEILRAFESRRDEIAHELSGIKEGDENAQALLEEYHELTERLEDSLWERRKERIHVVLEGLGFSESDFDRLTDEFSGGWQMRIALAKILLQGADILLLDEPTNYLDIEARSWLEGFLTSYKGGYLIVSHDRYFLDVTVREVYEVWNGNLRRYPGNYSQYEIRRKAELEEILKRYEAQEEEVAKMEEFIRRFRYNESKAALVQSRIKMLSKIVPIEIPEGMKRMRFRFPPPPHSGRIALTIEALNKSYGDLAVLKGLDLLVEAGEKIALVGRNGAGKSTLMRIIAGADKDYSGTMRLGAGVTVGYFSQDMAERLDPSRSVEEELEASARTDQVPALRGLLGAFLFRGDDIYKSVSVLSGGERSRLALLKLLLSPSNLLVFDEPTNHLDLTSKDVLLEALKAFEGTVIFVSHDRYFLEALAGKVFELDRPSPGLPAIPRNFVGGYDYYLGRKEAESQVGTGLKGATARAGSSGGTAGMLGNASKPRDREEDKRRKSRMKKLERELAELLEKLEGLVARKKAIEVAFSDPAVYSDGSRVKELRDELGENEATQRKLEASWETMDAELEELRAQEV